MEMSQREDSVKLAVELRTPRIQKGRQRFSIGPRHSMQPAEENDSEDEIDNGLKDLIKQTWTIWGVSSLFGFERDELKLKLYAKRLREEVANTLSQDNVIYEAKFTLIENLAFSPTDPPALNIEIHTNTVGNEDAKKCIYKGILMSRRTALEERSDGKVLKLPVLLCRGTQNTIKAAHAAISQMFDCTIISLSATEDDLMWLIPIALSPDDTRGAQNQKGDLVMEYRIPGHPPTDTIIIKLPISKVSTLWDAIRRSDESESGAGLTVNIEQVENFHNILRTQMLYSAGLQLGLCVLHKISLPSLTIMENRMKVLNVEEMDSVLLFLQEKASDLLDPSYHNSETSGVS